jgi:hypothetical protein
MFEHKDEPLLSKKNFLIRFLRYAVISFGIIGFSLALGTIGYHYFGTLNWIDAFYNAAMILTGMGPVSEMPTNASKIFASLYAIYSGVAFLTVFAVLLAPALHRFMHILHLEESD